MNDNDLLRYSRQILLPDVDVDGQEKLLAAKVLIVGLGGLGSPVAMYLAAAGVGELHLADFDSVDLSNLQRQIIHQTDSVGQLKVDSAKQSLAALNAGVVVKTLPTRLSDDSLADAIAAVDIVVDCTDNFSTRFAINAHCVAHKKPLVSGAAIGLEGQVTVFDARIDHSPCYRCLYEDINDEQLSCSQNGVLATVVGVIGCVQATEVLKIIIGFGQSLVGRLLLWDAKAMQWRELKLPQDPACPVCKSVSQ